MRGRTYALVAVALALVLAACSGEGSADETAPADLTPPVERAVGAPQAQQPQGTPQAARPPGTSARDLPIAVFETASGGRPVMALEVADTDELRTCGLMHRLSMPADQGMLFVFNRNSAGPFWNRNTFIPLTLAWIAADGTIVDLTEMAPVRPEDNPQVNTFYAPRAAYRYVIEANQGWFARNGVAIGDRVRLDDALARGSQGAVPICRERGL